MLYEEFVRRVQARARLGSRGCAAAAIQATVEVLAQRIGRNEASRLATKLPAEVRKILLDHAPVIEADQTFTVQEFFRRVSDKQQTELGDAIIQARVVMEVLSEAVSPGDMDDLRNHLPDEFQLLFESVNRRTLFERRKHHGQFDYQ